MAVPGGNWQSLLAQKLQIPLTPELMRFFGAWQRAEGGSASNNPFNTTHNAPGATAYNSNGGNPVKNYPTLDEGLNATVNTINDGYYPALVRDLHQGASAKQLAQDVANSPWGTGSGVLRVLGETPSSSPAPVNNAAPNALRTLASADTARTKSPSLPTLAKDASDAASGLDLKGLLHITMANQARLARGQAPLWIGQNLLDAAMQTPGVAAAKTGADTIRIPQLKPTSNAPLTVPTPGAKPGSPVAHLTSEGGLHQTEGLPDYPAHDYFAPSGSAATAPISGKVIRLSGHPPSQGPVEGPHGPFGWSVYIQGTDGHIYYLTHMGSRDVRVGQTVKAGQTIGTVGDYAKYGTPSHIHMGVH